MVLVVGLLMASVDSYGKLLLAIKFSVINKIF